MTALAGIWNPAFDRRHQVQRMLQGQAIYGEHSADASLGDVTVARRLFRALPEDRYDAGPMTGGEGSLLLVADVRLDNRQELASLLSVGPARLRRLPDAALLLLALEKWDEETLERIVGDFAFALWKEREQRLMLARDFMGQRPLHYYRAPGFFAFASMPKGLHALPQIPYQLNHEALSHFLALVPETGAETFFEGIRKVPAGHVVTVTRHAISSRRYWSGPSSRIRLKNSAEYEEAVRSELDRAVAARLRGAGAVVAAHLSGGLDSSTVATTAARALQPEGRLIGYTAVPREGFVGGLPNSITDEGPLAADVVRLHPNIEHVKVLSSGGSPLDSLDRYYFACDRPLLNLCNGLWMTLILEDAQSRGLKVLLTGQAGNLSFSYDGMAVLSDMLRQGRVGTLARTVLGLRKGGMRTTTIAAQVMGSMMPERCWRFIQKLRGKRAMITDYTLTNPSLVPSLTRVAKDRGFEASCRPRAGSHERRIWALQRVDHGNYNKGVLAGWKLDVRDPTADRRLVDLCLAIPPDQFLESNVPRSLARRAFRDRLPETVWRERRKGYQAADWHEALSRARASIEDEVERISATPAASALLDVHRMRQLVKDWPVNGWDSQRSLEEYRLALLRGLSAGHFVRRVAGSNF